MTSLTGTTNTAMAYDARGNLLNKGSDNFTYDSESRLTSATVNNITTNYQYNYRGQRIAKLFQNGEKRYYVYDLQALLIAELNSDAETQIEYIYLNGKRIALLVNSAPTTPYYVHTCHLDAPLAISNTSGNTIWQASYTPFGDVDITLDLLPESFTARFPGQYSDTATGFYYNYFRDYDPELGRYIQSDPIGLAGGINTYGYVGGNPLTYVDPLGLSRFGRRPSNVYANPWAVQRSLRKMGMRYNDYLNLANIVYMESVTAKGMFSCSCTTKNSSLPDAAKQCTPSNPEGSDVLIDNGQKLVPGGMSLLDTGCVCGIGVTINTFVNPPPFKGGR